jgi:anti-sigma factor RsiW
MTERPERLSDRELSELAAFADGSLPPSRRAQVGARIERSAELRALVDEQRVALDAVGRLDLQAPERLRARVEAAGAPKERRPWSVALGGGLAAAAAAALVAVLVVSGGSALTTADVASLADRGANAPAPEPAGTNLLAASVVGVSFPDFREEFGWRAQGARADELDGRATRTVFYERGGRQVAYTIVSGDALAWPAEAGKTIRDGVEFRTFEGDGATVVTWRRDGQTCVLSASDASERELLALAAWNGSGAVAF